jgi:hypothetical protein
MFAQHLAQAGCLAFARSLRTHAEILRSRAETAHLDDDERLVLLRDADATDRHADTWLDAAAEE